MARKDRENQRGFNNLDLEDFGEVRTESQIRADGTPAPAPETHQTETRRAEKAQPTTKVTAPETALDVPMSKKAVEAALKMLNECMQQPGMNTKSIKGNSGTFSPAETMVFLLGANAASSDTAARYGSKFDMASAIVEKGKTQGLANAFFDVINPTDTAQFPSLVKFINQGNKHICQKTHGIEAKQSVTAVLVDVARDAAKEMFASTEAETMLRASGLARGVSRDIEY